MTDIEIISHRGTNPYPDHTREAHIWAVNWGSNVIEPDLWMTKDGVLVVSHDNHNYSNLTYAEAKAAEPALQTFGEFIDLIKELSVETGRQLSIIPETKSTTYATSEAVIKELIAHDFTDPARVVIQSFSSANLKMLHETIMPQYGVDFPLAFLGYSMSAATIADTATYADIIAPNQSVITAAGVEAAHAAGLKVVAWTIAGTQAQIQRLVDMGVDSVFVDETNTAMAAVSNMNGIKLAYGTEGDDEITGTAGDDLIYAMKGDDTIEAGEGKDVVYGDAGDDVIDGGAGDDKLYGGAGDDELIGGAGNDILAGGVGDDLLDGGEGIDTADYSTDTAGVTVNLAEGFASGDEAGEDELISIENVIGGAGDDVLIGDAGDNVFVGGLGDDQIDGGAGFDTLDLSAATGPVTVDFTAGTASGAGIGTDSFVNIEKLLFGAGDDVITGGNGNDAFDGGAGDDTLKGGAGDDSLWGGEGDDLLDGGSGNDVLFGGTGDDVIKAGSGDDEIDAGEGDDVVDAGSGDDIVLGGAGNDVLDGGSGADRIEGGAGDDTLSGGSGQDVFVFAAGFGKDTITDFRTSGSSADVLEFDVDVFADFNAAIAAANQVGSDTVFTVDADTSLTLKGIQLSSLAQDDFRFV